MFIYRSILEYYLFGNTRIEATIFRSTYSALKKNKQHLLRAEFNVGSFFKMKTWNLFRLSFRNYHYYPLNMSRNVMLIYLIISIKIDIHKLFHVWSTRSIKVYHWYELHFSFRWSKSCLSQSNTWTSVHQRFVCWSKDHERIKS